MTEANVVDAATGEHLGKADVADEGRLPPGTRFATQEEQARLALERDQEGILGGVKAVGLGILKAVPGAVPLSLAMAGLESEKQREFARQRMQAIEKVHPVTTMLGEVGGFVAGGEVLGLGKLLSIPAQTAMGRIGVGAMRGVAEGAIMGTTSAVSEAAIDNRALTAEAVAAQAGMGALFGGAVGGALSGVGVGIGAGGRTLRRGLEQGAIPGGELLTKFWETASKAAGVLRSDVIKTYSPLTRAGRDAARYVTDGQKILDEHIPVAIGAVRRALGAVDNAEVAFSGRMKAAVAEEMASTETALAARAQSYRLLGGIGEAVGDMAKRGQGTYGHQDSLRLLLERIPAVAEEIAVESPATLRTGEVFLKMDALKRDFGTLAAGVSELTTEKATKSKLRDLYFHLRDHLERPDLFGELAVIQKRINPEWAEKIATRNVVRLESLGVLKRAPSKWGIPRFEVDEVRLQAMLEKAGTKQTRRALEGLDDVLRAGAKVVDAVGKTLTLPKETRRALQSYGKAVGTWNGARGEIEKVAAARADMAALGGRGGLAVTAGTMGLLAGVGGPEWMPLGLAAHAIVSPRTALAQMHGILGLSGRALRALERKASSSVAGGAVRVAGDLLPRAAEGLRTVAAWGGSSLGQQRRREEAIDVLRATPPDAIRQSARTVAVAVEDAAPELADGLADLSARAHAYLLEHIPRVRENPYAAGARRVGVSDHDWERFDRRLRAVTAPLGLIEQARRGGLVTPEAAHAFRAVYPEMHRRLAGQVADEVGKLSDRGRGVSYDRARALGTILGTPIDVLDVPEVTREVAKIYHAFERPDAASAATKRQRRRRGDVLDKADRIEGNMDLEGM